MADGVCETCAKRSTVQKRNFRMFLGEFIGTFLMCFCGIGAVAVATLYNAMTGPFQVGMVWGITIAIAIFVTRNLSAAHFNPAVTFAMCVAKRMSWKKFPLYLLGQCVGAFCAAGVLYLLLADSVSANLAANGIGMDVAGAASSIWCEPFPNTAAGVVTPLTAACAEGFGVFILVTVIFSLTEDCNLGRPSDFAAPLFIGLTITIIICVVGPLTDAGLNPARDLMPRFVAMLAGWGNVACTLQSLAVYELAPIIGGGLAAVFFTKVIEPQQHCGKCVDENGETICC